MTPWCFLHRPHSLPRPKRGTKDYLTKSNIFPIKLLNVCVSLSDNPFNRVSSIISKAVLQSSSNFFPFAVRLILNIRRCDGSIVFFKSFFFSKTATSSFILWGVMENRRLSCAEDKFFTCG